MYACGLRISEVTTLEVGAVDRANQVLLIVGEGDKERLVRLLAGQDCTQTQLPHFGRKRPMKSAYYVFRHHRPFSRGAKNSDAMNAENRRIAGCR